MKISIITPSYNQGDFIEECILSVLNQNFHDFEHIIIDCESTDSTLSILNLYPHLIWISEKDNGQSDALNKALKLATGDIIGWLNSDDIYCEGAFEHVVNAWKEYPNSMWLVGNQLKKFELTGKTYQMPFHQISYKSISKNCDILRTQSAFYKTSLFFLEGGFDENFHQVMDYDLWIRFSKKYQPINIKDNLSIFRVHRNQKTTINNSFKQLIELSKIFIRELNYVGLFNKSFRFFRQLITNFLKICLIKIGIIDSKFKEQPLLSQFKEHVG